jgi:hypothetical protein
VSDTSGLPNADAQGVPVEDDPERFEADAQDDASGAERDAQAAEPAETEQGQSDEGQSDEGQGAEPPPADFDPAQQPSNPDLVKNTEPPDE